jgi:hypothetical protein
VYFEEAGAERELGLQRLAPGSSAGCCRIVSFLRQFQENVEEGRERLTSL